MNLMANRWRHIGSNLKAITSALAAVAVDEGKIDLTGRIRSYSNLGYVLAAVMLERRWPGVYEDLLVTKLLQPLGMTGLGWDEGSGSSRSPTPLTSPPAGPGGPSTG